MNLDLYKLLSINIGECAECGSCAAMCYENAIQYEGLDLEEDNFLQENIKDLTGHLLADLVFW